MDQYSLLLFSVLVLYIHDLSDSDFHMSIANKTRNSLTEASSGCRLNMRGRVLYHQHDWLNNGLSPIWCQAIVWANTDIGQTACKGTPMYTGLRVIMLWVVNSWNYVQYCVISQGVCENWSYPNWAASGDNSLISLNDSAGLTRILYITCFVNLCCLGVFSEKLFKV